MKQIPKRLFAMCINDIDPHSEIKYEELNKNEYYLVDNVEIGNFSSTININNKTYNSVMFEYFNEKLEPINIYTTYPNYKYRKLGE